MDVLSMTKTYRENLLKFVEPILSGRSYIWVRNLVSDINRKIITMDSDYISAQAIIMYRNIVPFFKKYCTKVNASNVLLTLYMCAVELKIRKLGDEIESYEEFQEDIDMDDWSHVTEEVMKRFDIRTQQQLIMSYLKNETTEEILAGGLCALQIMDFV